MADNIVRDWNKLQGYSSSEDNSIQPLRDLNTRYITIENSATVPVAVALAVYAFGAVPKAQMILNAGEIKNLGVNTRGDLPLQFIHILDPINGKPLGAPNELRSTSNSYVLRNATTKWYVQYFYRPSYACAK